MNRRYYYFFTAGVVSLLLVFYGSFLTHKINLVTADLGRHIQNGRIFFETGHIVATNFYSYTSPDYYTVNHHWGSGAIFYLIFRLAGLVGVQLFFILVSLAAFGLMLYWASKRGGLALAGLISIAVIPLLAERTEVRPEALTYLFMAVFFVALWQYKLDRLPARRLWWLVWLELLWVNTHIFFFFGILIAGCFALDAVLQAPYFRSDKFRRLIYLLVSLVAVSFVNPFGYRGVIEPLTILHHYGYTLVENMPVLVIERLIRDPNFLLFKIVFALLVLSFGWMWWRRRQNFPVVNALLAVGLSFAAWWQIRNFAFFGLFALPIMVDNFRSRMVMQPPGESSRLVGRGLKITAALLVLIVVVILSGNGTRFFPYWHEFGLGLEANNAAPAEFFKTNHLQGPIFNNYDIGGYLIYYLYSQERVFVDNRPEAYPVAFFQQTYIPMQEKTNVWQAELQRYQFNAIIFSYHDATPWGQKFLIARIQDPLWAPVYVDQYVLILLRRNARNDAVIKKFEIPHSRFQIIPNPAA